MANPQLVSVRDFNTSRFSQLADTSTANISDILARAERAVQSKLQRPITPTSYSERYIPAQNKIYVRKYPIISVEGFNRQYTEFGFGIPVTNYTIDAETGIIYAGNIIGAIVDLTYTAGFEDVPEDIKEAILIQAALFTFQDLEIYGSGDSKEPGILYMKKDVEELLAPYKQLHTAFTRSI